MVTIVADTTSCLQVDEAASLGIPYIPQLIIFENQTYRDDTEMDSETFLDRLQKSTTLPKTAAPPPALYQPIYEKYGQNGNTILVLTPSADLSGTFRSAETCAQDYPDMDIRIIDTRTIGSGLASLILLANSWAKQGQDADTIVEKIKELMNRQKTYFVVDTLLYLYKGGRIGGAKMLFGSLLQVKPILELKDGRTEAAESQRTQKKAYARLKELIYQDCARSENPHITIMRSGVEDEAKILAADITGTLGLEGIPMYNLPPAILVHTGPGTIAFSYFKDKKN